MIYTFHFGFAVGCPSDRGSKDQSLEKLNAYRNDNISVTMGRQWHISPFTKNSLPTMPVHDN